MEVHLWRADATLHEPEDFRTFKVVAHGFTSTAELHQRLGALGRAAEDSDHVFVEAGWLAEHARDAADPREWRRRFEEMKALAARHGWVDAAGRIRAHVELAHS
jgi:hypothetical protein